MVVLCQVGWWVTQTASKRQWLIAASSTVFRSSAAATSAPNSPTTIWKVPPWDDPERYMRSSPITYVKNIHTPLLIIHSENDLRCGIEQSEQLFAALKYLGREVLFVRFEGQSHGLSRGGHPHSRVERLKHIQKWFADHLG